MLVIGLTGGIGSGKTTVANLFAKRGVPIIDADIIAREITSPGKPLHDVIIAHFQDKVTSKDGTLNRAKLRQEIFTNPDSKKWLEETLHPTIEAYLISALEKIEMPYCLLVIPLLIEVGSYPFIDRILVVDTSPKVQVDRVIKRDNARAEEVKAIIESQIDRNTRLTRAHDIVYNDGSLQELENQVIKLHKFYTDMTLGQV